MATFKFEFGDHVMYDGEEVIIAECSVGLYTGRNRYRLRSLCGILLNNGDYVYETQNRLSLCEDGEE